MFELKKLAKGLPSSLVLLVRRTACCTTSVCALRVHEAVVDRCKYKSGRMEFLLLPGVFKYNRNANINNKLLQ